MSRHFKIPAVLAVLTVLAVMIACAAHDEDPYKTNVRGVDLRNFDTTCAPCADFYQYANGNWLTRNPVPPEQSSWSTFNEVRERNNDLLKQILDELAAGRHAEGSLEQKIGAFFACGMDSASINRTGMEPLRADFERIESISSVDELCQVISDLQTEGVGALFGTGPTEDMFNSNMMNLWIVQGGLGLPERGYYTREDEDSKKLRDQYVEHIGNMFELLGDDSALARTNAEAVLGLETQLALASHDQVQLRDYPSWYRVKTIAEVRQIAPNFDWDGLLQTFGLPDLERVSFGPEPFFEGVNKALADVPLDTWKQYLRWELITNWAFYVGEKFDAESFRFYGTILNGTQERRERWKRVLETINVFLGEEMGQLYVKKAFPPETKARALEMVGNLKTALRERLNGLAWMSVGTKANALAKLDAFGQKIGYPDKWRDFSGLQLSDVSFVENGRAAARFNVKYGLSKVGRPPDPAEWVTTPQTTNAFYHPLKNEILFPAGILQPPLFDGTIDDAVNYGGVGMAIGHEMLHGFDDQGSRFDREGNMVNWWTDEDRRLFEERTARLVEMFGAYTVVDSLHVNGELTLGENIADLGGLTIAFRALQIAREGKEDPMVDGFTQEQRFFLAYAQIWRDNATPESIKLQVQSDVHPPARYRVIGPLSHMPEFYAAWSCTEGEPMVRPADSQIRIW